SKNVSRQHARLCLRQGVPCVEDLGSSNGTRVNGDLVKGIRELRPGDTVIFGDITFQVVDERPAARESHHVPEAGRGDREMSSTAPHARVERLENPNSGKNSRDHGKLAPVNAPPKPSQQVPQQPRSQVSRHRDSSESEASYRYAREICVGLLG